MRKTGLSFVEILILSGILVATVATSKKGDSTTTITNYMASTNCTNATQTNASITVTNSSISLPTGITFQNFGIPTTILAVSSLETVSGQVSAGVTRSCTGSTTTNNGATMYVYTCTDNSAPACLVTFTTL